MKLKHYIALGILLSYFVAANIEWGLSNRCKNDIFSINRGTKCGKVIEDFTELCNVKHGTRTEYYLKVQYDTGIVIERVSPETFYTYHKVGSWICFTITEKMPLWVCIGVCVSWLVGMIAIIVCIIIYLIPLK